MDVHDLFQEEYYHEMRFLSSPPSGKVCGLEIWASQSQKPAIRDVTLDMSPGSTDLDEWLERKGRFTAPESVASLGQVHSSMRLLHYETDSLDEWNEGGLPFTVDSWRRVATSLHLPKAYSSVLSQSATTPLAMVLGENSWDTSIGFILHSSIFPTHFINTALTYDPTEKSISGFLSFTGMWPGSAGSLLLQRIRKAPTLISDPMIIFLMLLDIWVKQLRYDHRRVYVALRRIQQDTGLLTSYVGASASGTPARNFGDKFDLMHQRIIEQHAYLTTVRAGFAVASVKSMSSVLDRFEGHLNKAKGREEGTTTLVYNSLHARQYLELLKLQVEEEVNFRQRMLDRITIYLQVLYNLMQQEISRETRKDSSAMKSIALLTMVFLPATALATIAAPFVSMNDDNSLRMSGQIWIFWAVAAPVTFVVIIIWAVWIQRKEVKELIGRARSRPSKLQIDHKEQLAVGQTPLYPEPGCDT